VGFEIHLPVEIIEIAQVMPVKLRVLERSNQLALLTSFAAHTGKLSPRRPGSKVQIRWPGGQSRIIAYLYELGRGKIGLCGTDPGLSEPRIMGD
jgi:hypothetical protein